MEDKINLLIIQGTNREGRKSIHAARLIEKLASGMPEYEVKFVDPRDFSFYPDDKKDPRYSELTAWADAYFIVTPEYNQGYPGSLKTMLDSELENYRMKPVYIAGVSNGIFGGARAIQSLVPPLRRLGMILGPRDLNFPKIQEIFNDDGTLLDPVYSENTQKALNDLLRTSAIMKKARSEP